MTISLVVAAARNGVIGKAGALPWRVPSDLKRFRALTLGKPVIMGRKTWEGLPLQPLPERSNIVITRSEGYAAPGAQVAATPAEALRLAAHSGAAEIMVIGGGDIYRQFLPLAQRVYLTEIQSEPGGDTVFPPLDPAQWQEVCTEPLERAPKDSASSILRIFERTR